MLKQAIQKAKAARAMSKLLSGFAEAEGKSEGMDQALAVLEDFGLQVSFDEIPCEQRLAVNELETIAAACVQPGAKLFRARIAKEGMPELVAFVVMKPMPVAELVP